jgi:hypothetical protein
MKNELNTCFQQKFATGSYGVGIGRAWCSLRYERQPKTHPQQSNQKPNGKTPTNLSQNPQSPKTPQTPNAHTPTTPPYHSNFAQPWQVPAQSKSQVTPHRNLPNCPPINPPSRKQPANTPKYPQTPHRSPVQSKLQLHSQPSTGAIGDAQR